MGTNMLLMLIGIITLSVLSEAGKVINVDNQQYYLSHPHRKNWYQSHRYCAYHCMQLVDINDEDENNRILSIIKSPEYINDPIPHYWTSGTDLGSEGQFYWATNAQSVMFTDYARFQPDNKGGNENCLEIRGDFGWKWNDQVCELERYFICRNLVMAPLEIGEKPVRVANASFEYAYV